MHKNIDFSFVEHSRCKVAGWGETNKTHSTSETKRPNRLQWAYVPIRDIAKCRTDAFISSLKADFFHLANSNKSSALTWQHIKEIGKDSQYMYLNTSPCFLIQ